MPVTAEPKATAIQDTSVENNLGLVHACAHRFKGRGIEYDDLYQAGCMGLVKASAAFDAGRGVMFSTYAVPVILGEIRRLLDRKSTRLNSSHYQQSRMPSSA